VNDKKADDENKKVGNTKKDTSTTAASETQTSPLEPPSELLTQSSVEKTALALAEKGDQRETVELLKKAGAK
jgi:hypothetical protein